MLEILEDEDVVPMVLEVLRLSPREVAMVLRDDVTEAGRTG